MLGAGDGDPARPAIAAPHEVENDRSRLVEPVESHERGGLQREVVREMSLARHANRSPGAPATTRARASADRPARASASPSSRLASADADAEVEI